MIKVRNSSGEYPCYICESTLDSKKDLRLHTIEIHRGDPTAKTCTQCSSNFKDISSVRRHIKTVHMHVQQYVCSICAKKYSHKYDLEKHFQKKHSSVDYDTRSFKVCPECPSSLSSTAELKEHMQREHQKTINFIKCPYCVKIFFDQIYVKGHLRKVHNMDYPTLYVCQACPFSSPDAPAFTQHLEMVHSWDEVHFCAHKGCGEYFGREDALAAHSENHPKQTWSWSRRAHQEQLRCDELLPDTEHSSPPKFQCADCGYASVAREDIIAHMRVKHARTVVEGTQEGSPYVIASGILPYTEPEQSTSGERLDLAARDCSCSDFEFDDVDTREVVEPVQPRYSKHPSKKRKIKCLATVK